MADQIKKLSAGHSIEVLDAIMTEVEEARGEHDNLGERLDEMSSDTPTPSTAAPAMDGTAAAGTSTDYARADHIHPNDTSKQDALSAAQLAAVNSGIDSEKVAQYDSTTELEAKDRAALVELVDGGAKNIVQIGTAVTVTKNGVTAVSNTDGSITISGVSTSGSQFLIINDLYSGSTTSTYGSQIPIKVSNYVVKATGTRGVIIQAINYNSSTDTTVIDSSNDDVEFTATKSYIVFRLIIRGNADFTTPVTIYPMCSDSALYAISPELVPYRPSYQELYERVVALEQANQ